MEDNKRIPELDEFTGSVSNDDLLIIYDVSEDETLHIPISDLPFAFSSGTFANDIEITTLSKGLIIKSPDGSRWRMGVSNAGATTWTKL